MLHLAFKPSFADYYSCCPSERVISVFHRTTHILVSYKTFIAIIIITMIDIITKNILSDKLNSSFLFFILFILKSDVAIL